MTLVVATDSFVEFTAAVAEATARGELVLVSGPTDEGRYVATTVDADEGEGEE